MFLTRYRAKERSPNAHSVSGRYTAEKNVTHAELECASPFFSQGGKNRIPQGQTVRKRKRRPLREQTVNFLPKKTREFPDEVVKDTGRPPQSAPLCFPRPL